MDHVSHAVGFAYKPSLRGGSGESRWQYARDHDHDDLRVVCLRETGQIEAVEVAGCRGFRKQYADIIAALKNGSGIVGGRCFNNFKAFPSRPSAAIARTYGSASTTRTTVWEEVSVSYTVTETHSVATSKVGT